MSRVGMIVAMAAFLVVAILAAAALLGLLHRGA